MPLRDSAPLFDEDQLYPARATLSGGLGGSSIMDGVILAE